MGQRNSGYDRKEFDLYSTPEWVTHSVMPNLPRKPSKIWEPACGPESKMANVLQNYANTIRTDIIFGQDFLEHKGYDGVDTIITNPPFNLAEEFIFHTLQLLPWDGMAAFLLRTDFDHAKRRWDLFGHCPFFYGKVVLTKRIVWFEPKPGEKGKSPSFNHAWFIWHKINKNTPRLMYV